MRNSATLLIGTSLIAFTVPASAQSTQESVAQAANQSPAYQSQAEIIVTATKRASRVQDVPFSINAQTQEDIQRANAQTLEDISRNVAGLTVQNLGPGQSQVSVRGVSAGQIARDQPGVKEQVGVYLDETVTALSLFTPDFDLFDLNRVETLRGPQGTLFGSGSVGGTLRYITNQPNVDHVEGMVEGDINDLKDGGYRRFAERRDQHTDGAHRGVARRRLRNALRRVHRLRSARTTRKTSMMATVSAARVSLLFQPTPELKITPRVVYQKVEAGGFNREDHYILFNNEFTTGGNTLGDREQYLLFREKFRDKTWLADLVASYDFGPAEITSVSSYVNRDILVSRDASALSDSVFLSFVDGYDGVDPVRTAALANYLMTELNLRDTTKLKQFTQELRIASTGTGPFQWVFGGFIRRSIGNISKRYRLWAAKMPKI